MKRTTILLRDDLARLVDLERKRRDTSAASIVREALEVYFGQKATEARRLGFIGIGASAHTDTSERIDEILKEGWADAIYNDR